MIARKARMARAGPNRQIDGMTGSIEKRIAQLDWPALQAGLDENGFAVTPALLTPSQCRDLIKLYADGPLFRSKVIMQRHAFGKGEYQYFRYPMPEPVQALRETLYPHLAPVANGWSERLGEQTKFPLNL